MRTTQADKAGFLQPSPRERSSYELDGSTPSYTEQHPSQQQITQVPSDANGKVVPLHWRAPTMMVGYLLVGIGFALGHHLYWNSLEGTVVPSETDQEWSKRLGIAAAFIAQSTLTLAVGVAYTQRVWLSVKRRPMTLSSLDKVFSLQEDVFAFLSWEVLRKAKFLCLLGLVAWCMPISSTVSSATLSVRTGVVTNVTEVVVPVPDFSNNSTRQSIWGTYEGVGRLSTPTPAVTRVVSATSTSMQILPFAAPFPNSSYSIDFYGPAFRCQNLSEAILEEDMLDLGDASSLQGAFDEALNLTTTSNLDSAYLSAAASVENHLFVTTGYDGGFGRFGQNYSCHWWNVSYAVDIVFSNGEQTTNLRALKYVAPMNIASDQIVDTYAPGEIQYWTLFTSLKHILVAEVGWGSTGYMVGADSALLQSGIAACPDMTTASSSASGMFSTISSDWMCRAGSVPGAIEDLSRNATLSLLSSALLSAEARVNVTVSTAATFYAYNWRNLVTAYALAVAAAVLSVGVGMQALLANGYSAGASFSSILLTTRNPDLDELARGHCLGARPMPDEVGRTVLRFGVLKSQPCDEKGGGHAAFGLGDDVRTLRKGEPCW